MNNLKKIVSSLLVFIFLWSHIALAVNEIQNEVNVNEQENTLVETNPETDQIDAQLNISKYVPFSEGELKGIFLQVNLKTKLAQSKFPIKTSNIQIETPILLEKRPDDVKVISYGTKATNGHDANEQLNYTYQPENGLLTLIVQNENHEQEEGFWNKDIYDEYAFSFIYLGEEVYTQAVQNGIHSSMKAKINIDVYASEEVKIEEKLLEGSINVNEKVGDITHFELNTTVSKIDKGIFYDKSQKDNIFYQVQYVSHIGYAAIVPSIEFSQEQVDFLQGRENVATNLTGANYQQIKINVENFNTILGESGAIEVFNQDVVSLGMITKETQQEDGYYVLDCSSFQYEKLMIKTTKPISEGKLEIDILKKIPSEHLAVEEKIRDYSSLTTNIVGEATSSKQVLSKIIELSEPVSKASFAIKNSDGNANFSTAIEYKDVEARTVFHASEYSCALFQNPTLEIMFPPNMKDVVIHDMHLLLKDTLEIGDMKVREENGSEIFTIKLKGEQTEYQIGNALQGTNLVMNLDFRIDLLTPTQTNEIIMTYTNEKTPVYEQTNERGEGTAKAQIQFIAPNGIISSSGMTGYEEDESISTIKQETITKLLPVNAAARDITFWGDIVNNYDHAISEVKILGRLPFSGNKVIDEQKELGSNINTKLLNLITISEMDQSKFDIYYTKQKEPSSDLTDINNEWTKTPSNLAEVKCYLIALKENLKEKQHFRFSFTVQVPEKLEFENSSYTQYKTYYTNQAEEGIFQESNISAILGITTGEGPKISVQLSANVSENAQLKEGKIIKFKAVIKNEGGVEAEEVKFYLNLPKGVELVNLDVGSNHYIVEKGTKFEYPLGNIPAGKEVIKEYEIQLTDDFEREVLDLKKEYIDHGDPSKTIEERIAEANRIFVEDTYQMKVENMVSITESRIENPISSNSFVFYKTKGDIQIVNVGKVSQEVSLKKGDKFKFVTRMNNLNADTIQNAKIWTTLPEGIQITDAYLQKNGEKISDKVNYHENKIEANILEMETSITYTLVYEIEVMDYIGEMSVIMYGNGNGISNVQESNELKYMVDEVKLKIQQTSTTAQYVKEGENISYRFTIQNTGNFALQNISFIDKLPDGVSFIEAKHGYQNGTKNKVTVSKSKKFQISAYSLKAGETYEIEITVKADLLSDEKTREITNQGILTVQGNDSVTSNSLTHYIEYDPTQHGKGEIGRYSISGCLWNDENKNGRREDTETKISDVEVMLFDRKTNHVVTDVDSHQKKAVKTDNNGNYQFGNLVKGDYFVVFCYDAARYHITDYQKSGVEQFLNSDAISVKVVLDGKIENVGMTDQLSIKNSSIRNIDLGLYDAEKFDLKLDKYIHQITLTTPTIGTKTYRYDNNIAKIEILGQNLGKSNVVIEYKIVVTNEGAVPGYVKKIVDYLPETLQFNSQMNRKWYQGKGNDLYCTELENIEIQPGESKEVSLIVTKKITEGSLGVIRNEAEIYETYNVQGLQDIDSTAGNKVKEEDDMSFAEIVISLVTGKIIIGIILTILILSAILISCYQIKKKVLTKEIKKG